MDAPLGSAVIQTAEQYRYFQARRDEVTRKYYERLKLFATNKNEIVPSLLHVFRLTNRLELRYTALSARRYIRI